MKNKKLYDFSIIRAICCGLYVVVEEVEVGRPENVRRYVENTNEILSRARYRKAWLDFIGESAQ